MYFVMEFVPGGSLADRLKAGPLEVRAAAELVRDLARAVQAAHDANVVHRDLKPGNVLMDGAGRPKVSDFGLARLLDADGEQTVTGLLLGTPAYMAPEQAEGRTGEVGPPADVWALGVILYECLTGKTPFRGSSRSERLRRIRRDEPAPLRASRPEVPAELEAVCLKC